MTQDATTGMILGYDAVHPFAKVKLTDRASVQELLRTLLDPLEPFFSPGKARVRCPGATAVRFDQAASEVEGICRPLWGLACLLAGGGEYRGAGWWVEGVKAGTDPESDEYWGYPRDNDQRMVEMCPLGEFFFSGGHNEWVLRDGGAVAEMCVCVCHRLCAGCCSSLLGLDV